MIKVLSVIYITMYDFSCVRAFFKSKPNNILHVSFDALIDRKEFSNYRLDLMS